MAFVILSITATGAYATSNLAGLNLPPVPSTVWSPGLNPEDGPYGSLAPTTFQFPLTPGPTTVPIVLAGTFTFPPAWQNQEYIVTATLRGTLVMQSDAIPVPPSPGAVVTVPRMLLVAPATTTDIPPLPFRWAGDFVWDIALSSAPDAKTAATTPTRLELSWLASAPPQPTPQNPQVVDFGGAYPIGLLRMFLPVPTEFSSIPANVPVVQWYLQRSLLQIWHWDTNDEIPVTVPLKYNSISGTPGYGVGAFGGLFRLRRFTMNMFQLVNCYDLAALAQLACNILRDGQGQEVPQSSWVYQWPNGYIVPGALFGWPEYPNCNNPFWAANSGGYATTPYVPDSVWQANPSLRSCFGNHAWVEVLSATGTPGYVLDATHGLLSPPNPPPVVLVNLPFYGQLDRAGYAAAQIDQSQLLNPKAKGNLWNNDGTTTSGGNCYMSPIFQKNLIGVTSLGLTVFGLPAPSPAPTLPPHLTTALESALARCRTPNAPPAALSNAPLHREALSSLLASIASEHEIHEYLVGSTGVQLLASVADKTRDKIYLELTLLVDFATALEYLTQILLGIQPDLESIRPPDSAAALGAYAFYAPTHLFWLRGNAVGRVFYGGVPAGLASTFSGSLREGEKEREEVFREVEAACVRIASAVDGYVGRFGEGEVRRPVVGRPGEGAERAKFIIRKGETKELVLALDGDGDGDVDVIEEKSVEGGHPVVLWVNNTITSANGGKPEKEGKPQKEVSFTFFGQQPGKTEVTLSVAKKGNLSVGSVRVEVICE
ncbi:hypothetical protein DFH27DRAFT_650720 [Peziza echinospora]|nr:hypothetical protein DFH27DRAFT_650720 [Peziza echinospora]